MFTKTRKTRALSLSQSDTALSNLPYNEDDSGAKHKSLKKSKNRNKKKDKKKPKSKGKKKPNKGKKNNKSSNTEMRMRKPKYKIPKKRRSALIVSKTKQKQMQTNKKAPKQSISSKPKQREIQKCKSVNINILQPNSPLLCSNSPNTYPIPPIELDIVGDGIISNIESTVNIPERPVTVPADMSFETRSVSFTDHRTIEKRWKKRGKLIQERKDRPSTGGGVLGGNSNTRSRSRKQVKSAKKSNRKNSTSPLVYYKANAFFEQNHQEHYRSKSKAHVRRQQSAKRRHKQRKLEMQRKRKLKKTAHHNPHSKSLFVSESFGNRTRSKSQGTLRDYNSEESERNTKSAVGLKKRNKNIGFSNQGPSQIQASKSYHKLANQSNTNHVNAPLQYRSNSTKRIKSFHNPNQLHQKRKRHIRAPSLQLLPSISKLVMRSVSQSDGDNGVEFLGYKHYAHRPSLTFAKPSLDVLLSPKGKHTQPQFLGYKKQKPAYGFRGKGKHKRKKEQSPPPSPARDKFTFTRIKRKYQPHKIQWTDSDDFSSETDSDDLADDPPVFTFGASNTTASDNNYSFDDEDEDDDVFDDDNDEKKKRRQRSMTIDALISGMNFDIVDDDGDDDDANDTTQSSSYNEYQTPDDDDCNNSSSDDGLKNYKTKMYVSPKKQDSSFMISITEADNSNDEKDSSYDDNGDDDANMEVMSANSGSGSTSDDKDSGSEELLFDFDFLKKLIDQSDNDDQNAE